MTVPTLTKDAVVFVEGPAGSERHGCVVHATQEGRVVLLCPAELSVDPGLPVRLFYSVAGSFWGQDGIWVGPGEDAPLGASEVEMGGSPRRIEQRIGFRVHVESDGVRARLAGQDCAVLDLSEVSFAVRADAEWKLGDVLEAVLYDDGEALPGRVCVQSVAPLERCWKRYGLGCIDGRLKSGLAAICLAVQRSEILRTRSQRRQSPG